MRFQRGITWLAAVALAFALAPAAFAQSTGDPVKDLQRQVDQLKSEIAAMKAGNTGGDAGRVAELERRLEVLAGEIEKLKIGEAAAAADRSDFGLGPAASKVYRAERGISIGGYGEIAWQKIQETGEGEEDDLRAKAEDEEEEEEGAPGRHFDLRRAVVYFGYKWSDRIVFNSEVEYEHAGDEVSVEFAYLDFLWRPEANFRAGLILLPVGFLNELHEPTVFLGADRPDVEQRILPSTWREGGFGLFGQAGPFTYRTYIVDGLNAAGFTDDGLRGGRQGGDEASAKDLAWVGRLDYTGIPGLTVGGSVYAGKAGQGLEAPDGRELGVSTRIYEGHLEWKWRGLEFRALGAQARLSDVAALNAALDLEGDESVGERLTGYYVQAGYDLLAGRGGQALVPFIRWETLNTQDSVPSGFRANPDTDIRNLTVGLEFKPIEQVVIKADYRDVHNRARTGADRVTLLLGYVF